jgi:exodeoxyribonuclease VII large subunit
MFKTNAINLNFIPKDGESVVVKGRISVYEKDGAYQLYCTEMKQEGIGQLYIAFQELKNKLEKQGLFDIEHKRPVPKYPERIGVITSPTGAAVRDIIHVARRRNKAVELVLYPALVQGENASEDIIRGLSILNSIKDIDVIILARGGGSIEELWAFNNEKLAHAVYNSKKPVITGVGHETDFTIVDFVSDMRAPTPSAAAEIAVPSFKVLNNTIESYKRHLNRSIENNLRDIDSRIKLLSKTIDAHSPMNYIANQYNHIDNLQNRLLAIINSRLQLKKEKLGRVNAIIDAHNPLKVLNKGYALIQEANGRLITEIEQLRSNKEIAITIKEGKAKAEIKYLGEL